MVDDRVAEHRGRVAAEDAEAFRGMLEPDLRQRPRVAGLAAQAQIGHGRCGWRGLGRWRRWGRFEGRRAERAQPRQRFGRLRRRRDVS